MVSDDSNAHTAGRLLAIWLSAGLTLGFATTTTACSRESGGVTSSRRDSAGVEIVTNPARDRSLGWTLRREMDLGSVDREATSFHGLRDQAVAFGRNGRLFVLDSGNHRVVVFDASGDPVATFGREGEGPGRFRNPVAIWTRASGDTVEVLDWALGAIVPFTADGESLEPRPVDVAAVGMGDRLRPHDRGSIYKIRPGFRNYGLDSVRVRLIRSSPEDTSLLATMNRAGPRPARFDRCNLTVDVEPVFEPSMAWDARGGRVAVNTSTAYEVAVRRDGQLVRLVRRPIPPEEVTFDDAIEEAKANLADDDGKLEMAGCPIGWSEWVERSGHRSRLQVVDRIRVDPEGRVWVRRNAVAGEGPIDVFDATGAYLGTLPPNAPYPAEFDTGQRFAATHTDELDLPHVAVYRIEEEDGG